MIKVVIAAASIILATANAQSCDTTDNSPCPGQKPTDVWVYQAVPTLNQTSDDCYALAPHGIFYADSVTWNCSTTACDCISSGPGGENVIPGSAGVDISPRLVTADFPGLGTWQCSQFVGRYTIPVNGLACEYQYYFCKNPADAGVATASAALKPCGMSLPGVDASCPLVTDAGK